MKQIIALQKFIIQFPTISLGIWFTISLHTNPLFPMRYWQNSDTMRISGMRKEDQKLPAVISNTLRQVELFPWSSDFKS